MGEGSDLMKLTVDGREIEAREGSSVLEAVLEAGFFVPHPCYRPGREPNGACFFCMVEVEGEEEPVRACMMRAQDGMRVVTDSKRLRELRRRMAN
jgi:NADH dehydrogenase/NADH:ubiquinone oxidoreductase subunit G